MLNCSKLIFSLLIFCVLRTSSASLLSSLLDLIIPGGVDNVGENAELCELDTPGIAQYYGYEYETRNVTTKDGYILTVNCLFNSTSRNSSLNPVIAFHGFLSASNTFLLNFPNQSLALLLADEGYYVCLPDARGDGYSQGYINNSRNSNIPTNKYWRFSVDEIAEYDLPAVIDSVLDWTQSSKVIYIGHSQGTTTLFALLSSQPAYNEKISIFAALAPVTYFNQTRNNVYMGAGQFQFLLNGLYGSELSPQSDLQSLLLFAVCTLPTAELCKSLIFFTFGYTTHIDDSRLPVYLCHSPADGSWGQFLQYVQLAHVAAFQKYDFKSQNRQIYGQSSPPLYALGNVSAPVALFYSDFDTTADSNDALRLKSELSNLVYEQRLNTSVGFGHLDYVWGNDVNQIVYSDLFSLIKNY